jgi:ParB family chromosome partitioning protein
MRHGDIELIPICEIRIINPRSRSRMRFSYVVESIRAIGLKRPITVCQRAPDSDGTQYDLVCGQGRMEACLALGETTIPAVITEAPREEQFLMSLVENLARRPPSNHGLFLEVRSLRQRKYTEEEIACKLGLTPHYISGVVRLVEKGERRLIDAVEGGRLPISVAIEISSDDDHEVQRALSEAYEKGNLRGSHLRSARRLIAKRIARRRKLKKASTTARRLTGAKIVKEYRREIQKQRELAKKAAVTKERLVLLVSVLRRLFSDEHFVTLLRAEQLTEMPQPLAERLR